MNKSKLKKSVFAFCVFAGFFLMLNISSAAVDSLPDANQPEAVLIDELTIASSQAILEGQTRQMQVEEFEKWILFDSVEWTSSRPDIISCTKSGEIKGLKKGSATITVKAKIGDARDSITVYCAKKLNKSISSKSLYPVVYTCKTPFILNFQTLHYNIPLFLSSGKLDVKGTYGSYYYVEFIRNDKPYSGFILQNLMPENLASDEVFTQLSTYTLNVYAGVEKEQYKVTTDYKGTVKWVVSDGGIIEFDDKTGKVKGKSPGIATISATVGETTLVCTVHSIYIWPQEWTGKALKNTYVYKSKGTSYEATTLPLALDDGFTVKGDMGKDSSWVYGVSESGDWGFIPINYLSTKGTISQYNGLGWAWPLQNFNYNYVFSPYAPRSSENDEHRGIDINEKTNQADIEGQPLVAAFDGIVKDIGFHKDAGYYVCLLSNDKDFITGENLVAIYMHMNQLPPVSIGSEVKKGETKIGCAGNTGRSGGSHLHFEVNNINAGVYDSIRHSYVYTINPIYFYMNKSLMFNNGCSAAKDGYGFYWYNKNKG